MFVGFSHRTAFAADEVMMMGMLMDFVRDTPLAEIGGVDKAVPREEVECAIDRRFVEAGIALADARNDFIRRQMSRTVANDREDHFALGRQAMPFLTQALKIFRVVMHASPYCNWLQ